MFSMKSYCYRSLTVKTSLCCTRLFMITKKEKKPKQFTLLVRLAPLAQESLSPKLLKLKKFLEQCCHMLALFWCTSPDTFHWPQLDTGHTSQCTFALTCNGFFYVLMCPLLDFLLFSLKSKIVSMETIMPVVLMSLVIPLGNIYSQFTEVKMSLWI